MDEDVPGKGAGIRYGEIGALDTSDMLQAGVAAGNIYRSSTAGEAEVLDLPEVRQLHRYLVNEVRIRIFTLLFTVCRQVSSIWSSTWPKSRN